MVDIAGIEPAAPTVWRWCSTAELNVQSCKRKWWSQRESNPWPLQCHCSALPTELWPHITLIDCYIYWIISRIIFIIQMNGRTIWAKADSTRSSLESGLKTKSQNSDILKLSTLLCSSCCVYKISIRPTIPKVLA